MRLPLEDVTVIDLSHALAGPFCSTMLADFGARVIKLEPKGAGDIARAWGSPLPGGETAYFVSLHRNKQGIEVDLKHPRGKELFFELVARADVVLENYRTGALERLGLAYATARKHNISANLLFRWRSDLEVGRRKPRARPEFMPIALPAPPVASAAEGAPCGRSGVIEIELVGGRRVRIDGAVEKIVEVHAADVEGGHCYQDQRDLIRTLTTAGND